MKGNMGDDIERQAPTMPVMVVRPAEVTDDISVIDMWLILAKRKKIIAITMVIAILVGSVFSLTRAREYVYTAVIEIGTAVDSAGRGVLISAPQTVQAKLKNSYIPFVIKEFFESNPNYRADIKIAASIPKGSNIVVLSSKATEYEATTLKQLMTEATDHIVEDHKRLAAANRWQLQTQLLNAKLALEELTDPAAVEEKKKEIEVGLTKARLQLQALKDPRVLAVPKRELETDLITHRNTIKILEDREETLNGRFGRLDRLEKLVTQQITRLQAEISSAESQRQSASKSIHDAPTTMAMLMFDNELQKNRSRLAALEERLYVGLKNQRDELDTSIAKNQLSQKQEVQLIAQTQGKLENLVLDNETQQQELMPMVDQLEAKGKKFESDHNRETTAQRQEVSELEARLANINETQAIAPPMPSPQPSGAGPVATIALSIVIGLILGILTAFFSHFVQRVQDLPEPSA